MILKIKMLHNFHKIRISDNSLRIRISDNLTVPFFSIADMTLR